MEVDASFTSFVAEHVNQSASTAIIRALINATSQKETEPVLVMFVGSIVTT